MPGEIWRRLVMLVRRDRFNRELEEEMRSHVEMQAEGNRENGMDAAEARFAARRRFGNAALIKESSREAWGWRWLDALSQDVRFALRTLRKYPAFAVVAVLTLGLGIGANTLVFSLLEAVVLRPLPYREPDRLAMLWTVEAKSQRGMNSSYPDFRDWREQSRLFEGMAAFHDGSFNLTGDPEPEHVSALHITAGLIPLLGIQPILGRAPAKEDDRRVALLGHALWMRRFGGSRDVLGKPILLDGEAHTVVGVLPAGFHFPPVRFGSEPELFVPMTPNIDRASCFLRVAGRLRPGVSLLQAQAETSAIEARVASTPGQGVRIEPMQGWVAAGARTTTLMLLGAVGFVLLIACSNVANLLLSRGAARGREIAIRTAIGASRRRVIRQLLTEALVLAVLGGVLGVVLAYWGLPLLVALAPERSWAFARLRDAGVQLDLVVLAYAAVVSVVGCLLFGVLPACKVTQPVSRTPRSGRARGVLIGLEVALSFVLLCGAGLMMKSLARLLDVDPGFRTEGLLTMYVSLPEAKYPPPERGTEFFRRTLGRLRELPGVASADAVVDLPLTRTYTINGFETESPRPVQGSAMFHAVSSGYFQTMGIPLLRGRLLTEADSENAARVVVINRRTADRYWPGENLIGKAVVLTQGFVERTTEGTHLRLTKRRHEIVGIVGDVRQLGLDAEPRPELFLPYTQCPPDEMTFVLRTIVEPHSLIPAAKKEIWRVDPDLPVTDIKTMNDWISLETAPRRFVLLLIAGFALLAVALAAIGIYGVVSYSVKQREKEIGIRMALGAARRGVIMLVIRQSVPWLAAGIVAGMAGAAGLTRLLASHLYGVQPRDPATFIWAGFVLAVVALAANAVPARRATRVDPMEALRHE